MATQLKRPPGTRRAAARASREQREARLRQLGQVLRASRGDLTQREVAERLSELRGEELQQTAISRWELGIVDLSVEQIRDLETVLGLESGSILVAAGYVPPIRDVFGSLRIDPKIHPDLRDDLARIYQNFVNASTKMAANESAGRRPKKVAG